MSDHREALLDTMAKQLTVVQAAFNGMLAEYPGTPWSPMFVVEYDDEITLVEIGWSEDENMAQHVFTLAAAVLGYMMTQQKRVSCITLVTDTITWSGVAEDDAPPGGIEALATLFKEGHPKVTEALYLVTADGETSLDCFLPYTRLEGDRGAVFGEPFHPERCLNGCNLALEAAFGLTAEDLLPGVT